MTIKLNRKVVSVHYLEAHKGSKVLLHSLLTSVPVVGERRPLFQKNSDPYWRGVWVGPRANLDVLKNRKKSLVLTGILTLDPPPVC